MSFAGCKVLVTGAGKGKPIFFQCVIFLLLLYFLIEENEFCDKVFNRQIYKNNLVTAYNL